MQPSRGSGSATVFNFGHIRYLWHFDSCNSHLPGHVAQFDCNGVNRELFQNMRHVSGPNHVRHFLVGQLAHAGSWNMQACEAHESRTLFGTISTSLTAGSVLFTAHSRAFVLSLISIRALDPFPEEQYSSRSSFAACQTVSAWETRPCGFHIIRIDFSTIDSL